MPIFNYTFKKILISPSTWVIFALSVLVLSLAWSLPVAFGILFENFEWSKNLIIPMFLTEWKMIAFIVFISLMLLIFIGVKATQIFRDEIDDGTLLILVSKPISRNRIWIEKWLSFQVTVVSYIFLTIFISGLFLVIPGIGGPVFYLTFLPYMGILFGIALLFDLIFTSVVLLLSLVLNSKATIAITIGFAALINIFSQAIEPLVFIDPIYHQLSQAVSVFQDVEKKVTAEDVTWFKQQITNDSYQEDVHEIIKDVYQKEDALENYRDYPKIYAPVLEQEVFKEISTNGSSNYTPEEVENIKHIFHISNAFRQWKEQSIEELMTSNRVGEGEPGSGWIIFNPLNRVDYSADNVITAMKEPIKQETIDRFNSQVTKKKVMRYLNIFYQLYYLWNGAWGDNTALYVSPAKYQAISDPNLISFTKTDDNNYQADLNSDTYKIINFPALISVYVILGVVLLGASWYFFNRRDFA